LAPLARNQRAGVSSNGDGTTIEATRRAGADGYVLRDDRRTELMSAITALAAGKH
jgi:DNA-binding NarL/FixJ family response regulator